MKRLLVILALVCMTVCAYAQKDIPAGGCMEVASAGGDDEFTLYKVKDKEGNPSFFLSVTDVAFSSDYELLGVETTFSALNGSVLYFGATSEEVMANLDELLEMFDKPGGTQKEFTCRDGSTALCTLNKSIFGKSLRVGKVSIGKSDIKSLKSDFKATKKRYPDL